MAYEIWKWDAYTSKANGLLSTMIKIRTYLRKLQLIFLLASLTPEINDVLSSVLFLQGILNQWAIQGCDVKHVHWSLQNQGLPILHEGTQGSPCIFILKVKFCSSQEQDQSCSLLCISYFSLFGVPFVKHDFSLPMSTASVITNSWLGRLVESQGFPTIIFPHWHSLLPYTLIPFYTLSLPCILPWILSIRMRRGERRGLQGDCDLYYTSKWNFCDLSRVCVYNCCVWEKVLHSPAVWKWCRAIPRCNSSIRCFVWVSQNLGIFCSSLGSFLHRILMNMFFLSVFVLHACYMETVQGEQLVAVVHFSNLPKLVSPKVFVT